ncbi:MAG TPA: response regulator, partial [Mycobacteriales bacterium]|nr:response regulator [Mycobacteriales bacterium]
MLVPESLAVLVLEDSSADAELVADVLRDVLPQARLLGARTLGEAEQLLAAEHVDVALVDLSLPDADGLAVLTRLRAVHQDLPLVVLTGADGLETARAALAVGAQDFVRKGEMSASLLGRAVRYAVERAGAGRALRQAQGWATRLLDALEAPTCAVDAEGTVTASNEAFDRVVAALPGPPTPLPYALVAAAGLRLQPADAARVLDGLEQVLAGARPRSEHTCPV